MIASICSEPKVLEIMRVVNLFINIIKVAVPIILIIVTMLKFLDAVKSNDSDALQKASKKAITNGIAAVIIFLIPTIVTLIVRLTFPNKDYKNCFEIKTHEEIDIIFLDKEEELVNIAETTTSLTDYSNAVVYLQNVKDKDKKAEFDERLKFVKDMIDERNRKASKTVVETTGYGSQIKPSDEIRTACGYVFNEDTVQVRLRTCTDQFQYKDPDDALPGGAVFNGETYYAIKTIPFSKYKMGLFFGEIPPDYSTDNLLQIFAVMYKSVIFSSLVPRQVRRGEANIVLPELNYVAGSCTQNYKENLYRERYESGKYKEKIDQIMEATKYFILANEDGTITEARYNVDSGILDVMKKAAREGKDILGMLEAMKSGTYLAGYYKNASVYDCRNLIEGQVVEGATDEDIKNLNVNIIHLGDSRVQAYTGIKDYLEFNNSKESIYARFSTGYDDYFKSQMSSAKSELSRNKDRTYAITVNYGVNAKRAYKSFCDYYDRFVQGMDKKHQFYIVSVNPFDESKVTAYKDDNTNAKVEAFNNYMKDTCIPQIKRNSPNAQVFYCDTYGSISLEEWAKRKYIKEDGIHYTKEGSKYIYNYTKKCIASHQ